MSNWGPTSWIASIRIVSPVNSSSGWRSWDIKSRSNPSRTLCDRDFMAVSGRLMRPAGHRLAVALFVMMGYRYATKGRKFMPSGLLALDSLVVLGVMILVMDGAV